MVNRRSQLGRLSRKSGQVTVRISKDNLFLKRDWRMITCLLELLRQKSLVLERANPRLGIWLSRSTRMKEHRVCTRIRARMAKRRPQFRFWGGELQDAMHSVLWLIDGPVVTSESGLEFSSGCKACDEERSAVKRRDRSFNHSTESNERQADSRARLREMKMLSAGDASCFIFITCFEPDQWNRFCVVWPECTRRTVEFKF